MSEHRHPNVHTAWQQWSEDQTLHVVSPYINPHRYTARRKLFHNFIDHMHQSPNVQLHVVEVAFGDRPFEVTTSEDVQLRTNHAMWLKENVINIGVSRLPNDWKYAAYWDGDFHSTRHDWALEAIHMLQHHPWVQLFNGYAHMSHEHRPIQNRPSFAYAYHNYYGGRPASFELKNVCNIKNYQNISAETKAGILNTTPGATGGGWAFTNESFSAVGGLLDTCILGAGDWYMAFGLVGNKADGHPEAVSCGPAYLESIRRWQDRAFEVVKGNIGYIDNFCVHYWHGALKDRGYGNRWKILEEHNFDPNKDLVRDWQGLLKFVGNKPMMERDINKYFLSRNEDDISSKDKALY